LETTPVPVDISTPMLFAPLPAPPVPVTEIAPPLPTIEPESTTP